MDLHCPYCRFLMVVKGARPGSFSPRCSNCQEKFALVIPEGENATPIVKPLPRSADAAPGQQATVAPAPTPASTQPPHVTAPPASMAVTAPPPTVTKPPAATLPPAAATLPPTVAHAALHRAADPAHPHGDAASSATFPHPAPPPAAPPVAPPQAIATPAPMPREDHAQPGRTLGGYQLIRKLGQGGMGAVYLARQLSLDRNVAVKMLAPKLVGDAGLVARFTREAYAAAQLTHHNVVQVYDIGEAHGEHFYSMEYVEGDTLAGLVHRDGKLDPETAVAYTLQAARGLKFAHDRGLIHRDVKPDNLMLNAQGIVKVADLGLVKWHGLNDPAVANKSGGPQSPELTAFNHSMGTPAYMAPEQARDAAHVDHRADIYSLGCTLYDLLVGRPPFVGKTAIEVMTKHASEPITPPDVLSKRVPKEVSALLMKMVAKRPDERYADLGQCIVAMEDFLGTGGTGPFTPKEEHAAAIEQAASAYRNTARAKTTRYVAPAYFALIALIALMAAMLGDTLASRVLLAGTFVGLGVLTAAAYVIVAGVTRHDVVLGKLRPLVFGMRIVDWLKTLALIACVGLVLYVFDLGLAWGIVGVVALAAACIYHFGLQRPRDRERFVQVEAVHSMLRTMRLRGLDEDTLRQFVCRYSGQHWEEFYEAVFDYDAKIEARRRWGLGLRGKPRPKFAVWRDAIIAWANSRVRHRQEVRDRKLLAKTEERKLASEGVDLLHARKVAQREAAAMIKHSEVIRKRALAAHDDAQHAMAALRAARSAATAAPQPHVRHGPETHGGALHAPHKTTIEIVHHDYPEREHESAFQRRGGWTALIFGPSVRLPIALALLAAFALWFRQNNPDFPQKFGSETKAATDAEYDKLVVRRDAAGKIILSAPSASHQPSDPNKTVDLQITGLPVFLRHQLSGHVIGLAGLALLISCFVRGRKLGAMALIGVVLIVLGNFPGDTTVISAGIYSGAPSGTGSAIGGFAKITFAPVLQFIGAAILILGFVIGRETA